VIDSFFSFWNGLAKRNGKLKFRNRREAFEFVRRVKNASGGPNAKILEMRRNYEAIQETRTAASKPAVDKVSAVQF
tara:strand:+ start:3001 stop:3228 length:228 start_codon:yes stop_codon:yes gene_type:complete